MELLLELLLLGVDLLVEGGELALYLAQGILAGLLQLRSETGDERFDLDLGGGDGLLALGDDALVFSRDLGDQRVDAGDKAALLTVEDAFHLGQVVHPEELVFGPQNAAAPTVVAALLEGVDAALDVVLERLGGLLLARLEGFQRGRLEVGELLLDGVVGALVDAIDVIGDFLALELKLGLGFVLAIARPGESLLAVLAHLLAGAELFVL